MPDVCVMEAAIVRTEDSTCNAGASTPGEKPDIPRNRAVLHPPAAALILQASRPDGTSLPAQRERKRFMIDGDLGHIASAWCSHRWWHADTRTGGLPLTPFRLWHIAAGRIEVDTGASLEAYVAGQWVSAPRSFVAQKMLAGTELISLGMEWRLADGSTPLRRIPEGVLALGRHGRTLRQLLLAQCELRLKRNSTVPFRDKDRDLPGLVLTRAGLWQIAGVLMGIFPEAEAGDAATSATDGRVSLAMRTLRHRSRSRFPAARLEQVTGLGRRRLEQLFLEVIGISPRAYHARLRMEEARILVEQGRMQFKEIAASLDFTSPGAFTQAFIRAFGISPSACQDQARA